MTKEFLRQGQEFDLEDILQNQAGQARIETTPGKFITISVTSDELNLSAENTPFFFRAEARRGNLAINTLLKDGQGNRDSALPSGKDLVRIAMDFLEAHNNINEFHALWKDGTDNFSQFLAHRDPWQTWSGQNIALAYGFTQIQNVMPLLYGSDQFVSVHFARPKQSTP